ncbi:MAG TPA: nucleoside hydrolase [Bacteroidales bacterium]|nr:nucleoside hydrolase [Bacteroidales bacterium]HPT22257.1 nucleoside hydrolase [Bacteroidales bacterium]
MKKVIVFLLILFFSTAIRSQPLPVHLRQSVIIDSDGAIDDMRALSIMLNRPEIKVKAILLSDGSLTPVDGAEKVCTLLHEFNCDSITVACGDVNKGVNPPWRQFNKKIIWGSQTVRFTAGLNAVDCLAEKLNNTNEKIILVCLGPLTNIAKLIKKDATLLSKVERIIWYNESVKPLEGFNYDCDKASTDIVFNSRVRIDVISNLGKENVLFDSSMYEVCRQSKSRMATVLHNVHNQPAVLEKLRQNHFRLCDELVALYLTNPELFGVNIMTDKLNVRYVKDYDDQEVREAFCDMIRGTYVAEHNVVFNRFPADREMFNYDIRPIMDSAIARYGSDEWKANVMTDEFHGHLGVFSIVGAKMGIRAREIFGVGPDELRVISYAGTRPPYSCMNDGIQVSTGATLGMGTIQLATDSITRPSAVFTFKGRSVMISLKNEYFKQVDADINEGILQFGLMDDGYWKLIRRNALKYWLEWDRNKIFDITEITPKK